MLPKKIHYCWFGGNPLPESAKKCIASWRKYFPDYEIIEWNEDNFDINYNAYTKMCYEQRKFAFLTDYLRLLIVEREGGIYFDTDVEVIKPFDDLLDCQAFFGFETDKNIATGLGFGSVSDSMIIKQMISQYDGLLDGRHGTVGCPILNTIALEKAGFQLNGKSQQIDGVWVYSSDYFNPMNNNTGKIKLTPNTHSVHRYTMSWMDPKTRNRSKVTRVFHRLFGENCFAWLKRKD